MTECRSGLISRSSSLRTRRRRVKQSLLIPKQAFAGALLICFSAGTLSGWGALLASAFAGSDSSHLAPRAFSAKSGDGLADQALAFTAQVSRLLSKKDVLTVEERTRVAQGLATLLVADMSLPPGTGISSPVRSEIARLSQHPALADSQRVAVEIGEEIAGHERVQAHAVSGDGVHLRDDPVLKNYYSGPFFMWDGSLPKGVYDKALLKKFFAAFIENRLPAVYGPSYWQGPQTLADEYLNTLDSGQKTSWLILQEIIAQRFDFSDALVLNGRARVRLSIQVEGLPEGWYDEVILRLDESGRPHALELVPNSGVFNAGPVYPGPGIDMDSPDGRREALLEYVFGMAKSWGATGAYERYLLRRYVIERGLLNPEVPFTEADVLKMQGLLVRRINFNHAGHYRTGSVVTRTGIFSYEAGYPEAEEVPRLMEGFVAWLNDPSGKSGLPYQELQSEVYVQIADRIHPFQNGTGRVGGLIGRLLMLRRGELPDLELSGGTEKLKDYFRETGFTPKEAVLELPANAVGVNRPTADVSRIPQDAQKSSGDGIQAADDVLRALEREIHEGLVSKGADDGGETIPLYSLRENPEVSLLLMLEQASALERPIRLLVDQRAYERMRAGGVLSRLESFMERHRIEPDFGLRDLLKLVVLTEDAETARALVNEGYVTDAVDVSDWRVNEALPLEKLQQLLASQTEFGLQDFDELIIDEGFNLGIDPFELRRNHIAFTLINVDGTAVFNIDADIGPRLLNLEHLKEFV